jgi:hypothetical protein
MSLFWVACVVPKTSRFEFDPGQASSRRKRNYIFRHRIWFIKKVRRETYNTEKRSREPIGKHSLHSKFGAIFKATLCWCWLLAPPVGFCLQEITIESSRECGKDYSAQVTKDPASAAGFQAKQCWNISHGHCHHVTEHRTTCVVLFCEK